MARRRVLKFVAPGGCEAAGFAREVAPGKNLVAPGDCEGPGFGNLEAPGECAVAPDGWPHDNSISTIYIVKDGNNRHSRHFAHLGWVSEVSEVSVIFGLSYIYYI